MQEVRLAFIGFGNVAQGLTQILLEKGEFYAQKYGVHFLITAIADPVKGNAFHPDGLSPSELLAAARALGDAGLLPLRHAQRKRARLLPVDQAGGRAARRARRNARGDIAHAVAGHNAQQQHGAHAAQV